MERKIMGGFLPPKTSQKGIKVYMTLQRGVAGETYRLECPACRWELSSTPEEAGVVKVTCPKCGAVMGYKAVMPKTAPEKSSSDTTVKLAPKNLLKHNGKLVWGLFNHNEGRLRLGQNIVGRADELTPSDISINDSYASRRSVSIEVIKSETHSGYKFRLMVRSAANPVCVNGKEYAVGESIYLNYGDQLRLGKTILTLKEDKHK